MPSFRPEVRARLRKSKRMEIVAIIIIMGAIMILSLGRDPPPDYDLHLSR